MTDRASAEGLRAALLAAYELGDSGRVRMDVPVEHLLDTIRAALRDTGPRPDSDPWPDLDGADTGSRPDSEGPWRDDQGYWLGGMGTPDTGPRPDSGIDAEAVLRVFDSLSGVKYDGGLLSRNDPAIRRSDFARALARLSTPRTETRE